MADCVRPVVLLLSGGMDSGLLAATAPKGSIALHIDYRQPAADMERAHARAIAHAYGLLFRRVPVSVNPGAMHKGVGAEGPRVVGGRNLMFLSLAISVACECGLQRVWIGASMGDHEEYPDCRSGFIAAVNTLAFATYGVSVQAPLAGVTREAIRKRIAELGLETWSCYEPRGAEPCGTCNACRRSVAA